MSYLIDEYNELKTERKLLLKEVKTKRRNYNRIIKDSRACLESIDILTAVDKNIHKDYIAQIEKVVTSAIRHVYERNFSFKIIYENKRNNSEARIVIIEEDGEEFNIEDDYGGGLIDICSFALRIILWKLKSQSAGIFFLDEPFKWTGSYMERAGEMLKYLCKELDIQVVLISHDDSLINICDKVYQISYNGKESKARLLDK